MQLLSELYLFVLMVVILSIQIGGIVYSKFLLLHAYFFPTQKLVPEKCYVIYYIKAVPMVRLKGRCCTAHM